MAKDKKQKKAKLPKEVLGIKLPKELREAGGALLEKANSPQGREMLAAGLTMAAAAASAAVARNRTQAKTTSEPRAEAKASPPPGAGGTHKAPDPQVIADALGQAADAVLGRLFGKKA